MIINTSPAYFDVFDELVATLGEVQSDLDAVYINDCINVDGSEDIFVGLLDYVGEIIDDVLWYSFYLKHRP